MKGIRLLGAALVTTLAALPAWSVEVAGIEVAEKATLEDGHAVSLNGAGTRSKLFFTIYVGALYLSRPATSAEEVLSRDEPNRVMMHFIYDEVEAEKLVAAWNEGFQDNTPAAEMTALGERIEAFNALFTTARKGDVILLDYVPGTGTRMSMNGEVRGTVPGADFNRALLRIWLGESPASSGLKEAMLRGGG